MCAFAGSKKTSPATAGLSEKRRAAASAIQWCAPPREHQGDQSEPKKRDRARLGYVRGGVEPVDADPLWPVDELEACHAAREGGAEGSYSLRETVRRDAYCEGGTGPEGVSRCGGPVHASPELEVREVRPAGTRPAGAVRKDLPIERDAVDWVPEHQDELIVARTSPRRVARSRNIRARVPDECIEPGMEVRSVSGAGCAVGGAESDEAAAYLVYEAIAIVCLVGDGSGNRDEPDAEHAVEIVLHGCVTTGAAREGYPFEVEHDCRGRRNAHCQRSEGGGDRHRIAKHLHVVPVHKVDLNCRLCVLLLLDDRTSDAMHSSRRYRAKGMPND